MAERRAAVAVNSPRVGRLGMGRGVGERGRQARADTDEDEDVF